MKWDPKKFDVFEGVHFCQTPQVKWEWAALVPGAWAKLGNGSFSHDVSFPGTDLLSIFKVG